MAEIATKSTKSEPVIDEKKSDSEIAEKSSVFAIIKTGGKQYKVEVGSIIEVEKIDSEPNTKIEFDDIFGGKKVDATILAQGRSKKIDVFKFHAKKRYQRLMGHRQAFTQIKIDQIK